MSKKLILRATTLLPILMPQFHTALVNGLFVHCGVIVGALSAHENPMKPVVLALASNERYYPGLYCAVASALNHVSWKTSVNLWVLDGSISQASKDRLERLVTPQFLIPKRSDWRMTRRS